MNIILQDCVTVHVEKLSEFKFIVDFTSDGKWFLLDIRQKFFSVAIYNILSIIICRGVLIKNMFTSVKIGNDYYISGLYIFTFHFVKKNAATVRSIASLKKIRLILGLKILK